MNEQREAPLWPYPIQVRGLWKYIKSLDEIPSDDLVFEREPTNPVDPNAIVVFSVVGKSKLLWKKIGYVSQYIARKIDDEDLPKRGKILCKEMGSEQGVMIQF